MSAYTNQNLLAGYISSQNLIALTDDTASGQVNVAVLNQSIASASATVDGLLCATYQTPFTNPPAQVIEAATIFTCEALFGRRLVPGENNPFKSQAASWRETLKGIAQNGGGLDAATPRAYTPGYVEQIWSRLNSDTL
jgi:phage gp36-like protein